MPVSTGKLLIVALLGALAVFLGTLVLTLQVLIAQHKALLASRNGKVSKSTETLPESSSNVIAEVRKNDTITPSQPTKDIFLWKKINRDLSSTQNAAAHYWSQVESFLGTLGDVIGNNGITLTSNYHPSSRHFHTSLLEASRLGHSHAQHYVASALASGIWLTGHAMQNTTVSDDFMDAPAEAFLLWHMAALDGNIEAAITLGNRISSFETDCSASLPYFEAAANGIMDYLETDKQSRAKVNPPMDKHSLPEIHLHGGTSSQLTWDNKPDESQEAIQYYHLLSTRQPDGDFQASYTLAQLYHYGLRGVSKNLTKALYYYEIAAKHDLFEAAGQAGKFHFWSLGMDPLERDLAKAYDHFLKGARWDLEKCRDKHRQALKLKSKSQSIEESSLALCDHPSLNGLGLIYLYGVPHLREVDVDKARDYFQLSRDMGNMDAAYNLAMMRLGYKAGWRDMVGSVENVKTKFSLPTFMENPSSYPSRETWILALKDLQSAANKGHLQARHRLAMIYQGGVEVGGTVYIPKDCKQAAANYRHVITNGSPYLSKRTRMAYKQYMAGDYDGALINYLMAAETGHSLSQINAAFLLDRGICLHLSELNCRIASLRLWKAAASSGDQEAALRVGDFYYYGIKKNPTLLDAILFPEDHLLTLLTKHVKIAKASLMAFVQQQLKHVEAVEDNCSESCENVEAKQFESDADMEKAAYYYRLASRQFKSARANFNLGFMHEWGLGLQQDFPLAKRHYDLARENSIQAGPAVQMALIAMNVHEAVVRMSSILWDGTNRIGPDSEAGLASSIEQTKRSVFIKRILCWEAFAVTAFTVILIRLLHHRP